MSNSEVVAVRFLGWTLIITAIGIILCALASLGFNTKLSYTDNNKKIEVRTENSNYNQLNTVD